MQPLTLSRPGPNLLTLRGFNSRHSLIFEAGEKRPKENEEETERNEEVGEGGAVYHNCAGPKGNPSLVQHAPYSMQCAQ